MSMNVNSSPPIQTSRPGRSAPRRSIRLLQFLLVGILTLSLALPASAQVLISRDLEARLGARMAQEIEARYGVWDEAELTARVTTIGRALAAVSDRSDITYTFKILNDARVNALAVPGGFVYVFRGTFSVVENDDELAFVLGHELGHIAGRHGVQRLEGSLLVAAIIRIASGGDQNLERWATVAWMLIERGWSRQQELEADRRGITSLAGAGFNPASALDVIQRLLKLQGERTSLLDQLLATHPLWRDRYEAAAVVVGSLR